MDHRFYTAAVVHADLREAVQRIHTSATAPPIEHAGTLILPFPVGEKHRLGYVAIAATPDGPQQRFGYLDRSPDMTEAIRVLAERLSAGETPDQDVGAVFAATAADVRGARLGNDELGTFLRHFALMTDLPALRAHMRLRRRRSERHPCLPDYDGLRALDEPLRGFVRNWPWLVGTAFRPGFVRNAEAPRDLAARAFIARWPDLCRPDPDFARRLGGVLDRLRGYDEPDPRSDIDEEFAAALAALADMPPEWLPRTLDARPGDPVAKTGADAALAFEWEAALGICAITFRLADLTGRRPRSLIGSFPGSWRAFRRDVLTAAGNAEYECEHIDFPRMTGHCSDMLSAFEGQVLLPALARAGYDVKGWGNVDRDLTQHDYDEADRRVRRASARFLLRDKGWRAIAELSRQWTSATTAIAAAEARLVGDEGWQVPFDVVRLQDPQGEIEIRALANPLDLVEEGVAGADRAGVLGLDHCIASYREECAARTSIMLSIRARDAEGRLVRLSTAQIGLSTARLRMEHSGGPDLRVLQHRGRGNANPDARAERAIEALLARPEAKAIVACIRESGVRIPRQVPYDPTVPGSVESMLEAWRFALPREVRSLPVEALAHRLFSLAESKAEQVVDSAPRMA